MDGGQSDFVDGRIYLQRFVNVLMRKVERKLPPDVSTVCSKGYRVSGIPDPLHYSKKPIHIFWRKVSQNIHYLISPTDFYSFKNVVLASTYSCYYLSQT